MTKALIPVPGTGFPKLKEVIRGLYILSLSNPPIITELMLSTVFLTKDSISKNSKFLVEVNVLKNPVNKNQPALNYRLTEFGLKLGKAIQQNNILESSSLWGVIADNNQLCQKVVNFIEFKKAVERQELKATIANGMILSKNAYRGSQVMAPAIIDILNVAHVITTTKEGPKEIITLNPSSNLFISKRRIVELAKIINNDFDLTKLICFCEELNIAYKNNSYMTVGVLTRAILDHVPPIFGKNYDTFAKVANNYGKSVKKSLLNLENSSRNIADAILHQPIRRKESITTEAQIDFRADLDVLLGEIIRIL